MLTTEETLSVNGTILNTLAKNIESIAGRLRVPALRTDNISVPGRHGTLRTTRKMYEEGQIILPMWVRGLDDDGLVEFSPRQTFYNNLDELTRLFRPGNGMLEVLHTLPDASVRRAWAECTEAITPTVLGGNPLGKFSVALKVPQVFWEDQTAAAVDLAMGHLGGVSELLGTTAPIEDSVLTLVGPITNGRVEALFDDDPLDNPTWFQYSGTVGAGQTLKVDCENWTLTGTGGMTVNYSNFSHGGGSRWLTLVPGIQVLAPGIKVTGSSTTPGVSKVVLTARRKFLVG